MFEKQMGESIYRAHQFPDGSYLFERKFDNVAESRFDEVALDQIPIVFLNEARTHFSALRQSPPRDRDDDMA